jgi:hypothetical protein
MPGASSSKSLTIGRASERVKFPVCMKRGISWAVSLILAALLVVYIGDYLSLRFQIPGGRPQFGQITVDPLYAIHVKNGKIQYEPGQQETDICVHSLFPHFGDSPCWYLSRHSDKIINI